MSKVGLLPETKVIPRPGIQLPNGATVIKFTKGNGETGIVLCVRSASFQPYVSWYWNGESTISGCYHDTLEMAIEVFNNRVEDNLVI